MGVGPKPFPSQHKVIPPSQQLSYVELSVLSTVGMEVGGTMDIRRMIYRWLSVTFNDITVPVRGAVTDAQ